MLEEKADTRRAQKESRSPYRGEEEKIRIKNKNKNKN